MSLHLGELRERGMVSALDDAFARALSRVAREERPEVLAAAALASQKLQRGDVCLSLPDWLGECSSAEGASDEGHADALGWPELDAWLALLRSSPLVRPAALDEAPGTTPLVLDEAGRLYLDRAYAAERRVAGALLALAAARDVAPGGAALQESLDRLLPASDGSQADGGPRAAARVAAEQRLCVVSGGPGTGKTTTAARLLAVLVEQAIDRGEPLPRIALAAPTGKAAARLAQAIGRAREQLDCSEVVRAAIPSQAKTLHRLLRIGFGRDRGVPRGPGSVAADLVLVDEASMVDLALMARLLEGLSDGARLVLLGDPDQLASVEAGAVFADVCGVGLGTASDADARSPIAACVVRLRHAHRYAADSGIGALAEAVRQGDADAALSALDDPRFADLQRIEPATGPALAGIAELVRAGYAPFAGASRPHEALEALGRFRVLCALRDGPRGVRELNAAVDRLLVEAGLLPPVLAGAPAASRGRPIGVTRNAPHVRLWNGDVGVVERDAPDRGAARGARESGARVFFEPLDPGAAPRGLAASRLPPHEPVFATTVHKSQGSEFDEVVLVLPDEPVPLLTRELLYTAVTRARRRVVVQAGEAVLRAAIDRRISRASGLRDLLWPGAGTRGTV